MEWRIKKFNDLSTEELYAVLKLRQEVFILEQTCLYQDIDGNDQASYHVLGYRNNKLVAYARILEKGISYDEMSIGRVLTSKSERGLGTGKVLMTKCMDYIKNDFNESLVRISAQAYLKDFYESIGFIKVSNEYLEDDIPHIEMLWRQS